MIGLRKRLGFPRYGAASLRDPQHEIEVWLHGSGEPINVTSNNVVAALRPFTIGIMFAQNPTPVKWSLLLRERTTSKRLLGSIGLKLVRTISLPSHQFCLFEATDCHNYCTPWLGIRMFYLHEWWRGMVRQCRNPYNFRMTTSDLHASYVFYICPRPVVLVTVIHEDRGNMFPMDLIGPTDSPWFSMALRLTSPAVRLMQESRRMVLASVPFHYKAIAYELGKHHGKPSIDFASLPFPTTASSLFGLPVADIALGVREVCLRECHQVGSHMLFLTSTERQTVPPLRDGADALQLFHSFGRYS